MTGTMIPLGDAGAFKGYLAKPPTGFGPGLIVLHEIFGVNPQIRALADLYAEEGYLVLAPDLYWQQRPGIELGSGREDLETAKACAARLDLECAMRDVGAAVEMLRSNPACDRKIGVIGFGLGGYFAWRAAASLGIDAAVAYYPDARGQLPGPADLIGCPIALHLEGQPVSRREAIKRALADRENAPIYEYPDSARGFDNWEHDAYDRFAASLAQSRTLGLLRRVLGPRYDLDALWERHARCEFELRDPGVTMATMVAQPYVNHVPTMTGGFGYAELRRFYAEHFIPRLPKDTKIVTVSRTVGADRVVDELLFCFTHDTEIDFLLPGVKPTGK
ncbi:MAG: dienelactone hydrolase family protein [Candidatus Binataceae bacterium]